MSDYADLDDEIRPHLVRYVRDVIRRGYSYYPEFDAPFWPETLAFWRHREAYYVHTLHLYARPETAARWGLNADEVEEYKRIRKDGDFVKFDSPSIGNAPDGWRDIIRRCTDELGIDVGLLEVDEDNGRLRIGISDIELSQDVRRSFVLAQFRSLYTCSVCGRSGRHLRPKTGPRITRCVEHIPPQVRDALVVYDEKKVPWREMSDGKWAYDPAVDTLICVP